ncbi:MAG TPA: SMI1/KNR4 family protein [Gemmata sp.]
MDSLLDRVHARIAEDRPCDHPGEWLPVQSPTTLAEVSAVEGQLGFRLPELLRRLYTEVGNGGFGPVFGLIPLTLVSLGDDVPAEAEFELAGGYARLIRRFGEQWPRGLVPAFYCGCTVFEFVDCRSPDGSVVWFDEGSEALSELLARETVPSLARRLEGWLAGEQPW